MSVGRGTESRAEEVKAPQDPQARNVKSESATCCRLAARLVASRYEVKLRAVVGRARGSPEVVRARHMAMYIAHVVGGLSLSSVGASFRRDRTTASYACRRVEDARDNPAFDAALADLEISAGVLLALQREKSSR